MTLPTDTDDANAKITKIANFMREVCGAAGHPNVYDALARAAVLHEIKNAGYRTKDDPLANFYNAAAVRKGRLTPLQYAHSQCEKQDEGLESLVFVPSGAEFIERGGYDMLLERALDGIVYRAIMIVLARTPKTRTTEAPGAQTHG